MKAKSEIKWERKPLNLFDMVREIHQKYPKKTTPILKNVFKYSTDTNITLLVENIDNNVKNELENTHLSDD